MLRQLKCVCKMLFVAFLQYMVKSHAMFVGRLSHTEMLFVQILRKCEAMGDTVYILFFIVKMCGIYISG